MRPSLRLGSLATAFLLSTACAACSSSPDEEGAGENASTSADPAWAETTSTLGVTRWALMPSDGGESVTLTGSDDAQQVRSQFVVDHTRDAAGNVVVRIRSMIQGPAVLEMRVLPDKNIGIIRNTFRDHPEADRALALAAANLKLPEQAPPGQLTTTSSRGLRPLDNGPPLVSNQQQLICKDARGNACQAPPDMGGVTGVGANCVAGVVGLAGSACLLTGAETIGVGCVISALGALYGAYTCYDGLAQNANCSCVTVCAAECQRRYNNYYACSQENPQPCSDAAAEDRRQEAACVSACGS